MILKLKHISWSVFLMLTTLILFAGCSKDDEGVKPSAAYLFAETVNCNVTTSNISTQGPKGLTFTAIIVSQGETQWCSFDSKTPLSETSGSVGTGVFLYLQRNLTDADRTAKFDVIFTDKNTTVYSTTLTLTQTKFSVSADYDKAWGEQPLYRVDDDFIYKTYFTTLASGRRVRNYSICYDRDKHVSHWVAYPIFTDYTSSRNYKVGTNTAGRTDAWAYDDSQTEYMASRPYYSVIGRTITQPEIPTSDQQYITNSYGAGGYNRGHMLASASRYSTWQTNAQTFYATNMMPQNGAFNSGTWANLESKERSWQARDTLFVVTGTYFANSTTIGNSNGSIAVPSHCWKVFIRTRSGSSGKAISQCSASELKSIGFIFSNSSSSADVLLTSGVRSVAEIEAQTGFTFFHNLDPEAAATVKSQKTISDWPGI